jgi:chromosomal replication initiation ATPase DnaA
VSPLEENYIFLSRRVLPIASIITFAAEPRNVAIYLLGSLRGDKLEEIGREFNITRFSSVSSVVKRMRGKISGDRQLKNRVEEIKTAYR